MTIQVSALDGAAARLQALERFHLALDCVNCYWDLINARRIQEQASVRAELFGVPRPLSGWVVTVERSPAFTQSTYSPVIRSVFDVAQIYDTETTDQLQPIQAWLERSMCQPSHTRTDRATRVVAAMRRLGQAAAAARRDMALLLYVIGLEALLKSRPGTKNRQLSLYCHAAAITPHSECDAMNEQLVDLYDLRSKIAHEGFDEISESDVARVRRLVLTLFKNFLLDPDLQLCETDEDFIAWCEECTTKYTIIRGNSDRTLFRSHPKTGPAD